VRTVFCWSYHSLKAPAARMFRLLGLHPGPDITAPAAASLAALTLGQARGLLRELTRCHLLAEPAPGRYALHDLLRSYAAEQADAEDGEPDRRAAIHRMLDHYLHTAYAASRALYPARDLIPLCEQQPTAQPEHIAGHDPALAWLKAEHRVVLNVITQAARDGFNSHAQELPETVATFLDRHGHWHDCLTSQHTALAAAQRMADPAGQARAHRYIGRACVRLGSYQDGYPHLARAMELCRDLGDHIGQARCHLAIALAAGGEGRYNMTLRHAEQALPQYMIAGHRAGQATALTEIGWYHSKAGQPQQALTPCQQSLDLNRELGNRDGEAESWTVLGYASHHLARHTEAIDYYRHALELLSELGHIYHQATVLSYLGDAHHDAGEPCAARETWIRALAILDDLHHPDADQVRAKLQDIDAASC
jgi:tetratricopeptide (TPR) repeat protein